MEKSIKKFDEQHKKSPRDEMGRIGKDRMDKLANELISNIKKESPMIPYIFDEPNRTIEVNYGYNKKNKDLLLVKFTYSPFEKELYKVQITSRVGGVVRVHGYNWVESAVKSYDRLPNYVKGTVDKIEKLNKKKK